MAYLVLLFLCCCILSMLDRLLLTNVMALSMLLSSVSALGQLYHFLFVVGQLPLPLQMHLSLCTLAEFLHKISYMYLLLRLILPNQIFSGMLMSRVHSVLADVSFLSNSQTFAVLGENLLK